MTNGMGKLGKVSESTDEAQYVFDSTVDGHTLTFPVEFVKEESGWKILEILEYGN